MANPRDAGAPGWNDGANAGAGDWNANAASGTGDNWNGGASGFGDINKENGGFFGDSNGVKVDTCRKLVKSFPLVDSNADARSTKAVARAVTSPKIALSLASPWERVSTAARKGEFSCHRDDLVIQSSFWTSHSKAECTEPRVFKGTCRICNNEGHPAALCPDKPADVCKNCKKEGKTYPFYCLQ